MNSNKALTSIFLICLTLAFAGFDAAAGRTQDQKENNREAKIVETLKLFGENAYCYSLLEISLNLIKAPRTDPAIKIQWEDVLPKIQKLSNQILQDEDLSKAFPRCVNEIISIDSAYIINKIVVVVKKSSQPTLTQIRDVIGKDNLMISGGNFSDKFLKCGHTNMYDQDDMFLDWYVYDWCWFGVDKAGKVAALGANFEQ